MEWRIDMQESQFTDKAKTSLILANKCARGLHQNYVGTEHILIAIMNEKGELAVKPLSSLTNGN